MAINYISTMLFIVLTVFFYQTVPYYAGFFDKIFAIPSRGISFHTDLLFFAVIIIYAICLIPYYYHYPQTSTFHKVLSYLGSQFSPHPQPRSDHIKQNILKLGVKFFFAPLMIFWLTDHCVTLINNLYAISGEWNLIWSNFPNFFSKHLFWNLFSLILFLDVFFFTVGYMTERDVLDNQIRSVQPYAIGWIVALLCYPPFNQVTSSILQWHSTDFPQFTNPIITVIIGLMICILMGIYTWASIALGWKASNLTNRGIVNHGPYAYVRHPAYVCKNSAWTLGALPVIITMISNNQRINVIGVILSLASRRALYYARAMTEEMHLSQDPDYVAYRKQVKYKYIPGIW